MKRITIKSGDTMWQLTHDIKVYVGTEWWSWYSKHCKVIEGKSILPNLLFPGDIIEIPEKAEWKLIKAEGEKIEANRRQHKEIKVPEHPFPFEPHPYQREILKMLSKSDHPSSLLWRRQTGRHYIGVDIGAVEGDKSIVTHAIKKNGRIFMYFDEYAEWPVYKWWRNPIKYFQWKRTMRLLRRTSKKSFVEVQTTKPTKEK